MKKHICGNCGQEFIYKQMRFKTYGVGTLNNQWKKFNLDEKTPHNCRDSKVKVYDKEEIARINERLRKSGSL